MLVGIDTMARAEQRLNALSPTVVTLLGIAASIRLVQFWNA
jgi:hypothetical protein